MKPKMRIEGMVLVISFMLAAKPAWSAPGDESLHDRILRQVIPAKLGQVIVRKGEARSLTVSRLGDPIKKMGSSIYLYNLSGIDYDTRIEFGQRGEIRSVRYLAPARRYPISTFSGLVTQRAIASARSDEAKAPRTHRSGSRFQIGSKQEGIELQFVDTEEPWLERVVLHMNGAVKP